MVTPRFLFAFAGGFFMRGAPGMYIMRIMEQLTWPYDPRLVPDDTDPDLEGWAADTAVLILWSLTGRQFGIEAVEARPCPVGSGMVGLPLEPSRGWFPVLDSGVVRNVSALGVGCGRDGRVVLPGPVVELLEFIVDGEPVSLESLTVEGDGIMRREGGWPGQNVSLTAEYPGTWAIRYLRGTPPPPGAGLMVGTLAAELLLARAGGKCRLPVRTTQVQRQGVTVQMVDPQDIIDRGSTGITEIDMWVKAVNPYGLAESPVVWSPDQAQPEN